MDTSAFIEQFDAATAALSSAREAMVAQIREFDADAAQVELPPTRLDDVAGRFEAQYAAEETTRRSTLESARAEIQSLHEQLGGATTELLDDAQSLAEDLVTRAAAAGSEIEAMQQAFEAAVVQFAQAQGENTARMREGYDEAAAALQGLVDALGEDRERVSSELAPALQDDIAAFTDAVDGSMSASIETGFEQGAQLADDAFRAAADALAQSFQQALGELDSGAQALQRHVGESLRDGLEEGARQLVDGATQRLAEEVVEGVVTSQAGVAVTTALGPYLPALIAIRRATDVIKHGLELLKRVTTLGLG
ncbi:MAG: hypothetical protein IT479_06790 [Xanthomonadales bacterium]|nr:hypothetical protein [Xanthomonadales bacterium]MCC6592967.1 hypothetical protein [Xanthomonadales bacterium]MCE7930607.1 hypothetical protein [Xanthomonadales bacterium PRO6]